MDEAPLRRQGLASLVLAFLLGESMQGASSSHRGKERWCGEGETPVVNVPFFVQSGLFPLPHTCHI